MLKDEIGEGLSVKPRHYDIDIVIKRDPLPEHASTDSVHERQTAAITLGHDQVRLVKLDQAGVMGEPHSETITVWDTQIPVTERKVSAATFLLQYIHGSSVSYDWSTLSGFVSHQTPCDYIE